MYHVIGYNQNDYITNLINWETLFITDSLASAESYVDEWVDKNYVCKIVENDNTYSSDIIKPGDDVHWEIYI